MNGCVWCGGCRLPSWTNAAKLTFLQIWVNIHIKDATNILNMPVLFCEFGKNSRVPGFVPAQRQQFFWTVYNSVFSSISKGGGGAGSMLWQLLPKGMEAWDDGFAIYASDSSTSSIIDVQTSRLSKARATLMAAAADKPKYRRLLL